MHQAFPRKLFTKNTFLLERVTVFTLPFAIDDPSQKPARTSDVNDLVVENNRKDSINEKGFRCSNISSSCGNYARKKGW